MARARVSLGARGERLAEAHLQRHGYRLVARNVRTRVGEIDLVMQGPEGLAFVEVRTRRGNAFGQPEESLTATKRARMEQCALGYLQEADLGDIDWRLDLVAVEMDVQGRLLRVEHIPGVEL